MDTAEKVNYLLERPKILVVEDNDINRQILCGILGDTYDLLEAENGQVALDVLEEYGEEIILIMLDIIMPVMDGYTFLSLIKKDSRYAGIPVIVSTTNDSENDEVKALAAGASDFIRKPYRPQIVRHRIESIIRLLETAAMVNRMKYDRLTGLFSKDYFVKLAEEVLVRNPDRKFDLMCMDIKHFSLINDMLGHSTGDHLLRLIANWLQQIAEQENGICGRISGDVFAVFWERSIAYSEALFDEYIEKLNQEFKRCRIYLVFGIYEIEDRNTSVYSACDRAISALETIKDEFVRNYAIYDDSIRRQKLEEQGIMDNVEAALQNNEFVLYYQPKYCLKTEEIVGAEALVRWQVPEGKLRMPDSFIPLFEKNGFISQLDQYVWAKACALIRKMKDAGDPLVPISVNVSRVDLHTPNLPEILNKILAEYQVEPELLHLEITESAYTDNPEAVIETVNRLHRDCFVIEMDDFGTGYSSLNMLNEIPIDILKLDKGFVQNNVQDDSRNILKYIISIAKQLKLCVVAEGSETKEQVDKLRELECDQTQGYYYSRPLPEDQFLKKLKENKAQKSV